MDLGVSLAWTAEVSPGSTSIPRGARRCSTEFLGETFSGIIGCDYYSVYRKFLAETDAVMQFCWAHLIRDVKFLITLSDGVDAAATATSC